THPPAGNVHHPPKAAVQRGHPQARSEPLVAVATPDRGWKERLLPHDSGRIGSAWSAVEPAAGAAPPLAAAPPAQPAPPYRAAPPTDSQTMPDASLLETFSTPAEAPFVIEHIAEEFTSVCPMTGHPDFGTVTIRFCPRPAGA